jgi:hypothetical protein
VIPTVSPGWQALYAAPAVEQDVAWLKAPAVVDRVHDPPAVDIHRLAVEPVAIVTVWFERTART